MWHAWRSWRKSHVRAKHPYRMPWSWHHRVWGFNFCLLVTRIILFNQLNGDRRLGAVSLFKFSPTRHFFQKYKITTLGPDCFFDSRILCSLMIQTLQFWAYCTIALLSYRQYTPCLKKKTVKIVFVIILSNFH